MRKEGREGGRRGETGQILEVALVGFQVHEVVIPF
jgi:hypothetical protein